MDLLTFFVRQHGLFPGRGVYLLPAAASFEGIETPADQAWDVTVPGSIPLYLLVHADPSGQIDLTQVSVSIDGTPVAGLERYLHWEVAALSAGRARQFAILDLVLPPPTAGTYALLVQRPGLDDSRVRAQYQVTVSPPDALAPHLYRGPRGRIFALAGAQRRLVPDASTEQALKVEETVAASDQFLGALPEGPPLPSLREGEIVRAAGVPGFFKIGSGQRMWSKTAPTGTSARTIDALVLQTLLPRLEEGMLLKGDAPDIYHVNRQSLRKVPDWDWVKAQRLDPANVIHVPERLVLRLPQNSPEWRQPGGTWRDAAFRSEALSRKMPYRVFLPPGYESAERRGVRYPVLYLLHGLSGRYDEWGGYGVDQIANDLYAEGKLTHMVLVMPQGGLGYWMNQEGGARWGDYVARDLVTHVDATYRTLARREARAIGGLSMGAHGAVQLALNYPGVFGTAGAHSPSIRSRDSAPPYFGSDEASFALRDPISLARTVQLESPPAIWIDAGEEDAWRPSAERLHHALEERGWPHEWHILPGDHDGWYWSDHLWEYLPYYASRFEKHGVAPVKEPAAQPEW